MNTDHNIVCSTRRGLVGRQRRKELLLKKLCKIGHKPIPQRSQNILPEIILVNLNAYK